MPFSPRKRDLNLVSCVVNQGVILHIVCYFPNMIYPPLDTVEPWFLYTGFFFYDIIIDIRELAFNLTIM